MVWECMRSGEGNLSEAGFRESKARVHTKRAVTKGTRPQGLWASQIFGLEEVSKPKETTQSLARSAQEDITGYLGVSEG